MKKISNNSWYRGPTEPQRITVVFVHGILSNSEACWLTSDGVFWPELVKIDARIDFTDIYLGGYYTSIDSYEYDTDQCSNELLKALKRKMPSTGVSVMSSDAIVFVCHSLGGIVVRNLLIFNQQLFQDKIVGLALYASPTKGSAYADFVEGITKLFGHKIGEMLRIKSPELRKINEKFLDLLNEKKDRIPNLVGMEAYESAGMFKPRLFFKKLWIPPIVPRDAMGEYFGAPRLIPETDHSSIVKPDRLEHPSQLALMDFINDQIYPLLRLSATNSSGISLRDRISQVFFTINVSDSEEIDRTQQEEEIRKWLREILDEFEGEN